MNSQQDHWFLADGGEMGALIRAFDWSKTSLGSPDTWSENLRVMVQIVLSCANPMLIWWGPDFVQIYNDGYRPSLTAERHPLALGQTARKCWPEKVDILGTDAEDIILGLGSFWTENELMPILRNGVMTDTYWTYSLNPIKDRTAPNGMGGVLIVSQEVTLAVLTEQKRVTDAARQRLLFEHAPGFVVILHGPDMVIEFVNKAADLLFGGRNCVGLKARDVFQDLAGQIFFGLLDHAYLTGERFVAQHTHARLQHAPTAIATDHYLDFTCEPVRDDAGLVTGIFIQGHDVTDAYLAHQKLSAIEIRQSFRISLDNALRDLTDPRIIMAMAAEMLGRHLDVERCGYSEIDTAIEYIKIKAEWTNGKMPPFDKRWHVRDFPPAMLNGYRNGLPFRLNDASNDSRISLDVKNTYRVAGIVAQISVPLVKDGKLVGALYAHTSISRQWTDADAALMRDVAELTWSVVERARAELLLRDLNETLERRVAERIQIAVLFEARFRSVFDLSSQIICLVDLDGTVLEANRLFWETVGVDQSDTAALMFWQMPQFRSSAALVATIKIGIEKAVEGESFKAKLDLHLPDNRQRSYSFSLDPVSDDNGQVIFIVAKGLDITDRLSMEEQLRQSQKMEAIGQLTGGIAHDFNNMLQVTSIALELARSRIASGRHSEALSLMDNAVKGVDRASSLTQRLLAFARRQILDPKPEWANHLILGMVDLVRRAVGEAVHVSFQVCDEQWTVICDGNQVENAILNLAINARDAMPNGGDLILSTHAVMLERDDVAGHEGVKPGEFVQIRIADSGVGMTSDVLAHAFEPFFTTKPFGEGTGLGLSQIYGFVQQSGGLVRLESKLGKGTVASIFLPRCPDHPGVPASQTDRIHKDGSEGGGKVIVLVEDVESVRLLVAVVLRDLGYVVMEARDGPAALRLLAEISQVDILITDLGLPMINGSQVAETARALRPSLPILFITGYAGSVLAGNTLLGTELLKKPFTLSALTTLVGRMAGELAA